MEGAKGLVIALRRLSSSSDWLDNLDQELGSNDDDAEASAPKGGVHLQTFEKISADDDLGREKDIYNSTQLTFLRNVDLLGNILRFNTDSKLNHPMVKSESHMNKVSARAEHNRLVEATKESVSEIRRTKNFKKKAKSMRASKESKNSRSRPSMAGEKGREISADGGRGKARKQSVSKSRGKAPRKAGSVGKRKAKKSRPGKVTRRKRHVKKTK